MLVGTASDLQFKAPLEIIKYPDPILRAKNKRVNKFDDNLKRLVHEMFDVMYRYVYFDISFNRIIAFLFNACKGLRNQEMIIEL